MHSFGQFPGVSNLMDPIQLPGLRILTFNWLMTNVFIVVLMSRAYLGFEIK